MPTKYPRHAITETPRVKDALDAVRAELAGERPDLAELLILGAREKALTLREQRERRGTAAKTLADLIRERRVPAADPAAAELVRRSGWARPDRAAV